MKSQRMLLSSLVALGATIGAAEAQTTSDDIVVTAQKREQSLQDVPISVAAHTGAAMEEAGVRSLQDLTNLTPGLNIGTTGGNSATFTYIRGGGTNLIDMSADPSVATFVDEVYIPGTTGMQFGLLDIERVEVLKGPQGTLFGRNAAAGAISIITRRPEAEFGGRLSLEGGNFGYINARGSVTGPLTADAAWQYRLAAMTRQRDPVTENLAGGEDPGRVDTYGLRGQLEYEGGAFNALLTVGYYNADNGPADVFTFTRGSTAGFFDAGGQAAVATHPNDFHRVWISDPGGYELQDITDASLRLEWATGLGELTSITSYRESEFDGTDDRDGSFADAMRSGFTERHETWSQELRLANEIGRWNWIAGAYYYHDEGYSNQRYDVGPDMVLYVDTFGQYISDQHWLKVESFAVFGQATYSFTEQLSLTLGARYTRDEKSSERDLFVDPMLYDFVISNFIFPVGSYTASGSDSWEAFNPVAVLQYEVSDDVMLYGSVRTGFKSGGYPTTNPPRPELAVTTYDPEDILSYEAGIRSDLFGGRLRINSSIFHVEMSDQQVSIFESGALVVRNAADGYTDGIDLQVRVRPTDRLTIDWNATGQRARFENFSYFSPIIAQTIDNSGNNQLRSPDFSTSLAVDYLVPMSIGELRLRGDYYMQTRTYFNDGNFDGNYGTFQPAYELFNARISFEPAGGNWEFALWGRNLGDERYCSNIIVWTLDNTPNGGTGTCSPADPRTYGVSVDFRF